MLREAAEKKRREAEEKKQKYKELHSQKKVFTLPLLFGADTSQHAEGGPPPSSRHSAGSPMSHGG